MKNPFLSNDNIFERLGKRQPIRRDKTPKPRNVSKDRTPIDRVSFGIQQNNPKPLHNLKQYKVDSLYDKTPISSINEDYSKLDEYKKPEVIDLSSKGRMSPKVYEKMNIPTTDQYQITTEEDDVYRPVVTKPNPFQNSLPAFERGRMPRKSQQLSFKDNPAQMREKSLTGQRRTTIESYKGESEPSQYVPTPKNTMPSLNLQTIQNKTEASVSGYDTLQKLNDIFNNHPVMSPKSQELGLSRGHNEPSIPFSPLSTGRPDDLDPALFQQYVQRCLMDSKGRQELEQLVGMQIPDVTSPRSNNIKIEDRYDIAPKIRSPPNNTQQSNRMPTFTKISENPKPAITLPTPYSPPVSPVIAAPKQHFSSELKIRQPSDYLGDLQSMRSEDEIINFQESMTKMKPYISPILTQKSNLRQPAQQSNLIGSPKEGGIRLSAKCNLTQKINDKMRHMYQRNDTRVFLTLTEKLTMRRCPLSQ